MTSRKHGLLPSTVQNGGLQVASSETNFVRMAGTSEAEASMSDKAECLLAIGEGRRVSSLE